MPETPSDLDRLKRQARGFAANIRPQHIAVVAVFGAVGLGVVAARTMALPQPQPIRDGDRMQIQVVAPVEPEIAPGSVMDVGDLVEGFEYRRLPPARIEPVGWDSYDEDFGEPEPRPEPRPAPRRYVDDAMAAAPPPPEAPAEGWRDTRAARWFGFDAPDRDYRAEREARRARIDARIERERERREVRWYRSDGQPAHEDGRDDRRRRNEDPEGPDDLRG